MSHFALKGTLPVLLSIFTGWQIATFVDILVKSFRWLAKVITLLLWLLRCKHKLLHWVQISYFLLNLERWEWAIFFFRYHKWLWGGVGL